MFLQVVFFDVQDFIEIHLPGPSSCLWKLDISSCCMWCIFSSILDCFSEIPPLPTTEVTGLSYTCIIRRGSSEPIYGRIAEKNFTLVIKFAPASKHFTCQGLSIGYSLSTEGY